MWRELQNRCTAKFPLETSSPHLQKNFHLLIFQCVNMWYPLFNVPDSKHRLSHHSLLSGPATLSGRKSPQYSFQPAWAEDHQSLPNDIRELSDRWGPALPQQSQPWDFRRLALSFISIKSSQWFIQGEWMEDSGLQQLALLTKFSAPTPSS